MDLQDENWKGREARMDANMKKSFLLRNCRGAEQMEVGGGSEW